jgi:hypothetical protein
MFLKMDIHTSTEYDTEDGEPLDTMSKPILRYSDPIKFTDVYDKDKGTVSVKQALLYMTHCCGTGDWRLPELVGKSSMYFAKTPAGARWGVPKPNWMR